MLHPGPLIMVALWQGLGREHEREVDNAPGCTAVVLSMTRYTL